mgnify:FL=1|jgi:hypothetical protein
MFEIHTTDTARLKRIAAAGGAGIVLGLVIMVLNFVVPVFTEQGHGAGNAVFGMFGLLVVLIAAHPTQQAAERLDEGS